MLLPQFRDPIHGFIEVSDLELKIVDSAPFQRLRNIKQLATTYLVYHGAEHTRFGHSLGVMHLTTRAFNSALDNYEKANDCKLFDDLKREWYAQILRLIALTHDLGHAPFSHASEALFGGELEHEHFTQKIIYETVISDYICEIGREFMEKHHVGDEYAITPELLWLIYHQENAELDEKYVMPDYKFLKSFLDSELDCDKMDYLLRDSYYCGVNYGKYDLNRLLCSLTVYHNAEHNILQLAIERGGVPAFEEFVIARYFMFIQVYFHKTRRYLDKLLVSCIATVLKGGIYPADIDEYLKLDDDVVYDRIKTAAQNNVDAKQFINRKVMSCVYESAAHSSSAADADVFNIVKRKLKNISGCNVLDDYASKMAHKIPMLEQYDADSGKGIPIILRHRDKPTSLSEESLLLQSLIKPINIKRLYVDKEHVEQARQVVRDILQGEGDD